MKWFNNINDLNELRKAYKKLAVLHHPDKGGSTSDMQEINNEYEILSKKLINSNPDFSEARKSYEYNVSEAIIKLIDEIINLAGIEIEMIGNWVWCSGNTKPVKDKLKESGFKFSRNKTAWYWHLGEYRKFNNKRFDLDDLRNMWGSEKFKKEQEKKEDSNRESTVLTWHD